MRKLKNPKQYLPAALTQGTLYRVFAVLSISVGCWGVERRPGACLHQTATWGRPERDVVLVHRENQGETQNTRTDAPRSYDYWSFEGFFVFCFFPPSTQCQIAKTYRKVKNSQQGLLCEDSYPPCGEVISSTVLASYYKQPHSLFILPLSTSHTEEKKNPTLTFQLGVF